MHHFALGTVVDTYLLRQTILRQPRPQFATPDTLIHYYRGYIFRDFPLLICATFSRPDTLAIPVKNDAPTPWPTSL
jgi:hypothetical protein